MDNLKSSINPVYTNELKLSLEEVFFAIDEVFSHSKSKEEAQFESIQTICDAIDEHTVKCNKTIDRICDTINFIGQFKQAALCQLNTPAPSNHGNINDLINEPIVINDIPITEREYKITIHHIQSVLNILRDKYQINLSLDGKDASDILDLNLKDDLDITPIDIKLFIPSMFLNYLNSDTKELSPALLYQEDYFIIESIANEKSNLRKLVELYSMMHARKYKGISLPDQEIL
jgi:hypothetical protein